MADAVKPATLPEDVILDLKVKFPISDNNKVPGAKNEIDAVKTEVKTPE